ncbi:MAG: PDZ domain-containing protein [Acidobacteriota bacterium]
MPIRQPSSRLTAAVLLAAAVLAVRCGGSGTAPAKSAAASAPSCAGTLGIEVRPLSRQARKKLGLPDDFAGALVTEVWSGGPAAAEDIRVGDVVEKIDNSRIGNDCDFGDNAFNRSCGPSRIVVLRAGARIEAMLSPVDQTSFLEKACQAGSASACFRKGWLLWSRKGGPNTVRALELFTSACASGSAEACAFKALQLMDEPDRGSDSLAAGERACTLDSGAGCAHLAFLYATGKFVKKDDHRATTLYARACDLGDPQGCYNVGLMADQGRGGAADQGRAFAKYEEACALGSSTGCTNLGFLYENGRGVKIDKVRAVALYQEGCDGTRCQPSNLGGCVNVGRALRDGIGLGKDEQRAAGIFREACDRKPNRDDIHADENGSRACSLLGALYIAGDGIAKDSEKGLELSALGCERGDAWGCFNAAALYSAGEGIAADAGKAASFLDLACNGGDGEGCFNLGVAYEKGNGVARDRRRSVELFRKSCQLGFTQACAKRK